MAPNATLRLLSPAKLNLHLEILGKRDDGFHELETLMTAVSIYDSMQFRLTDASSDDDRTAERIELACRWAYGFPQHGSSSDAALGSLPPMQQNLIFRTAKRMQERALADSSLRDESRELIGRGLQIDVVKRIPAAAGLGGASGNSATTIMALNRLWKLGWEQQRLSGIAAELGSDIPFFLHGGTAICRGRGELVAPLPAGGKIHMVVVRPPVSLSTAGVFQSLPQTSAGKGSRQQSMDSIVRAMRVGCVQEIGRHLFNRLQAAAAGMFDWINAVQREFALPGFFGHQLTGSGSCFFGVTASRRSALSLANRLRQRRIGIVYACSTV